MTTNTIYDLIPLLSPADQAEAAEPMPTPSAEAAKAMFIGTGLCEALEGYPSLLNFQGDLAICRRDNSLVFLTRDGVLIHEEA